MNNFLIPIVVLSALTSSLLGPPKDTDVIGKWKGSFVEDKGPGAKGSTAEDRENAKMEVDMLKGAKVDIEFRKDHTFVLDVKIVLFEANSKEEHTSKEEGKWKLDKNIVTITSLKEDGKPKTKPQVHTLTFSKDLKKLTLAEEKNIVFEFTRNASKK